MARQAKAKRISTVVAIVAAGLAIAPATALAATADLSITKTDSADPVAEGAELTYTLTVANAGPDEANGVEVEDKLPSDLDLVSAVPSQGNCATQGKTVTCALGALATGASASVAIKVLPKKAGQVSNTATVTTTDTDSAPANNTDTETTTVTEPPTAPTCAGRQATLVGTNASETLAGTNGADVILALGGNDTISGLGAKDVICAGAGNDVISGAGDNDLIKAGGGDDRLRGGDGNDDLRGGGGSDNLSGGRGNDSLRGGGGTDVCRGGGGKDSKRGC